MKREILGVALCGGESSRMGKDKGNLVVRHGVTQLDYAIEMLRNVCERVAVGIGSRDRSVPAGVGLIRDAENVPGPMAGVVAALRYASAWPVLIVACDMPYLEVSHLVQLLNRRDSDKLATSFLAADGKPDPMCSIYEPSCLSRMEDSICNGAFGLRRFLENQDIERVKLTRPELLASVNNLRELEQAREKLS